MNPMVFMILKLEKELEMQREGYTLRRNNDLEAIKPMPQPMKTDQEETAGPVRQPVTCGCPASSD